MTTNTSLTAVENVYGWSVVDPDGGQWWPDDETQTEIECSDDPETLAIQICLESPTRGEWIS